MVVINDKTGENRDGLIWAVRIKVIPFLEGRSGLEHSGAG